MIKLHHLIKEHLLYEGLIHSVSRSTFDDMISRWAITNDKIRILFRDYNKILIEFVKNIDEKELDNLLKLINNLGWFVSSCLIGNKKNNPKWKTFDKNEFKNNILYAFQIEAKFDLELTDMRYGVLYHITSSVNDPKIMKIGLIPKTLSKAGYHPERIYFTTTIEACEFMAQQFNKLNKNLDHFSIYEVDMKSAIKNNDQMRLFNDPNLRNSVYTLSNIPPKFIKFIKAIGV